MNTDKNNTQLPQSSVSVSVTSTELRIGNLISLYGKTVCVLGIDKGNTDDEEYYVSVNDGRKIGYWISQIKPIEITEDWLLKFGFKDNQLNAEHNLFVWYENHIGIKGMLGIVKPCKCVYVHQLQNLYFALTGLELQLDV